MIRVTVELLKQGDPGRRELLGVGEIANVGGDETRGDYAVRLFGKLGRAWKTASVEGFPRRRLGAWDLLFRALAEIVGGRSPRVALPDSWLSKDREPLDGGLSLAEVEADRDEEKKRTIAILVAWGSIPEPHRRAVIESLRLTESLRSRRAIGGDAIKAFSNAADVLEELGRLEPA